MSFQPLPTNRTVYFLRDGSGQAQAPTGPEANQDCWVPIYVVCRLCNHRRDNCTMHNKADVQRLQCPACGHKVAFAARFASEDSSHPSGVRWNLLVPAEIDLSREIGS